MQGTKAGFSYIGALALTDAVRARRAVLVAIDRSRGRMVSAAIELGTCRRHLERIAHELNLWPEIDACRERWQNGQGLGLVARTLAKFSRGAASV